MGRAAGDPNVFETSDIHAASTLSDRSAMMTYNEWISDVDPCNLRTKKGAWPQTTTQMFSTRTIGYSRIYDSGTMTCKGLITTNSRGRSRSRPHKKDQRPPGICLNIDRHIKAKHFITGRTHLQTGKTVAVGLWEAPNPLFTRAFSTRNIYSTIYSYI